jgi:class 3 adenylate cyclase/tetratricopeptide (TPR) repeat protein
MKFYEIVEQVLTLLQRQGRVSYRALKREFDLDDEYIADLREELVIARRVAADEDGRILVWIGEGEKGKWRNGEDGLASSVQSLESESPYSQMPSPQTLDSRPSDARLDAAERRQLTVLFCDLVGSTALSEQLDPEELRELVRAYQETCTGVIRRYDGHVAQHLGDGLLVYFGYPAAHEDDARRAVRAGLEIVAALQRQVPSLLAGEGQGEGVKVNTVDAPHPNLPPQGGKGQQKLQVRIGIHTGLVVIGEIGSGEKHEILALGETPNIAARIQGLAEPDTVMMSAATYRLVEGLFDCDALGPQTLKGISSPLAVYRVVEESDVQSRFDVTVRTGLTPLVGREEELRLLHTRWERAKAGHGQVILLSGEPGIGKSRLLQELKDSVARDDATCIEFRCSPYHQNSAFYPIINHLQRFLQFTPQESPYAKLAKLQQVLLTYRFPQADTLPLLATLFSLPHPEGIAPLTLSPQKQKQKTQEALVAWIMEEAEKAAVYCAWEDLHWADPSTLDVLTLFLEQIPTRRMFAALTFRPEFTPPWSQRSYLTPLVLNRLGRPHVEALVEQIAGSKALPPEVLRQIVAKTDGVPLFVEELTKMVLETIGQQATGNGEQEDAFVGAQRAAPMFHVGIPATLQDALMARLDRLNAAKEIAQLGATLGREFSYELLQAVSPLDETVLQQGLRQLVEAELLYQRGLPPQARYVFKHALIQDAAYQSLLKSKRQQLHQQIAQVLADQFPETVETQPELLAHHYTEAGLVTQAIPYWQQAGQKAVQRSANREAVNHFTRGLELLNLLPDAVERVQQELELQVALGSPLVAIEGYATQKVERTYNRALELCQRMGDTPQLFPVLRGLQLFYFVRANHAMARKIGEQLLTLAQRQGDLMLLAGAHLALGQTLSFQGDSTSALAHMKQGVALSDPAQTQFPTWAGGHPRVQCLLYGAVALHQLGYLDRALRWSNEALALAQKYAHSLTIAFALLFSGRVHRLRQELQLARERSEALIQLSREHGLPFYLAHGAILRGWTLVAQEQAREGIAQLRQGLETLDRIGAKLNRVEALGRLAAAYGAVGQASEGLMILDEAMVGMEETGEHLSESTLYRVRGELTLMQSGVLSPASRSQAEKEAEQFFLRAMEIARQRRTHFPELQAGVSLARLWQQQGKRHEAHTMLAAVYNWFTEGFDTKDLQEAKALLDVLA